MSFSDSLLFPLEMVLNLFLVAEGENVSSSGEVFGVSLILRLSLFLYKNIELTRDHVVLLFLFFSCKYTGVVKYEILIHFVDIFYKSNILSR